MMGMYVDRELGYHEVIINHDIFLDFDSIVQPLLPLVGHGTLPDFTFCNTELNAIKTTVFASVWKFNMCAILKASFWRPISQEIKLAAMLL